MSRWAGPLIAGVLAGVLTFGGTLVLGASRTPAARATQTQATQPVEPGPTDRDTPQPIDPFALATALPTPSTTPTPTPTPAPPVTIALAGDVHGEPPIENVLLSGGNPLDGVADVLSAADLAIVNLETAVGSRGAPADKTYTFQADPLLVDALADAGVDVVNLANNHGLDFGREAAGETIAEVARAGMAAVGYGADADEAYEPHLVNIDGRTVAVLGITRVLHTRGWEAGPERAGMASAYDPARAVAAVRAAAEIADHVVVTIHWGQERHVCPNAVQVDLARQFVAAGAAVVAGHHPHVLQGVVDLDGAVVAYSLGNFVFYARTPATRQTGVLTVTLDDDGVNHQWTPAEIQGATGGPVVVPTQAPLPRGETLTATSTGPECGPPAS